MTSTKRPGYICKTCGDVAPKGIGFATSEPAAVQRSGTTRVCACGASVNPRYLRRALRMGPKGTELAPCILMAGGKTSTIVWLGDGAAETVRKPAEYVSAY